MTFALFFLAEYGHIILMSLLNVLLFFGGWLSPIYFLPDSPIWLAIKTAFFVFAFIWVRASFPRIRYDQLMQLLWKNYLPLSLGFVVFISSVLIIGTL
jgi:NADH:ubiquinone oxidoreductase subunit H